MDILYEWQNIILYLPDITRSALNLFTKISSNLYRKQTKSILSVQNATIWRLYLDKPKKGKHYTINYLTFAGDKIKIY